jgi:glycosidase
MNRREGLMARSMQRNQMLFMGNHDLPRCLTLAGGDAGRVRAAWALLCLMDGELNLYYGDERAMQGGEDPANRGVMQWDSQDAALEMERFTRETLALRARLLSSGTESIRFEALSAHTARVRLIRDHKEYVLFLTNGRDANFTAELPDARLLLRGERFGKRAYERGGSQIASQQPFLNDVQQKKSGFQKINKSILVLLRRFRLFSPSAILQNP